MLGTCTVTDDRYDGYRLISSADWLVICQNDSIRQVVSFSFSTDFIIVFIYVHIYIHKIDRKKKKSVQDIM